MAQQQALTVRANGLLREIRTEVRVRGSAILGQFPLFDTVAIWDTGATNTAISDTLARQMELTPIDKVAVTGVHGTHQRDVFMIDIVLPNHVGFRGWHVTSGDLQDPLGLLIGMDIITLGDFAITNVDGNTVCSFRTPSVGPEIDYVADIEFNKLPRAERRKRMRDSRRKK